MKPEHDNVEVGQAGEATLWVPQRPDGTYQFGAANKNRDWFGTEEQIAKSTSKLVAFVPAKQGVLSPLGAGTTAPDNLYRKKPVVIKAVQWTGWEQGPHDLGVEKIKDSLSPGEAYGWISTLEGGHIVTPGDWIITGVKGERYPCKPDVFAATYEPATLPEVETTAPVVPEGWKLVPVDATVPMIQAGIDGLGSCVGSCGEASPPEWSDFRYCYAAMIEAAPTLPEAAAQEGDSADENSDQYVEYIAGICDAYESGIGHGLQQDGHSEAPYSEKAFRLAYGAGYEEGEERAIRAKNPVSLSNEMAWKVLVDEFGTTLRDTRYPAHVEIPDAESAGVVARKLLAEAIAPKHAVAASVQAQPQWLPVEFAPKDGTEILFRYPLQGNVKKLGAYDNLHGHWHSKGEAFFPEQQRCEWTPIPPDLPSPPVKEHGK